MTNKYNVGDIVKVVNAGRTYSTYQDFVRENLPEQECNYSDGAVPEGGGLYNVLLHAPHMRMGELMLYIIQDDDTQQIYVIDEEGLELSSPAKKPRLCEILGVEVNEEFEVSGLSATYRISTYGDREFLRDSAWKTCAFEVDLIYTINHPEKIIRKLKFSADEKACMRLLGDRWIARDKDGDLWLYTEKPGKHEATFDTERGDTYRCPEHLFPQITWENSPIHTTDYMGGSND